MHLPEKKKFIGLKISATRNIGGEARSPEEVVRFCQDQIRGIIDLRSTDLPGTLQHLSIPLSELTEGNLADGYGFDGSGIRGFKDIE